MHISLIVAMAENGVIGAKGAMPWHLSTDLKRFKALTMGKPIIMGGKTHRSIGKALPGRDNIVITRHPEALPDDVQGAKDWDEALSLAQDGSQEIMVIGGGEIYAQAMPHANRLYVTEVQGDFEGDTYFPAFDRSNWREVLREAHAPGENNSAAFSFVVLERYNIP